MKKDLLIQESFNKEWELFFNKMDFNQIYSTNGKTKEKIVRSTGCGGKIRNTLVQ